LRFEHDERTRLQIDASRHLFLWPTPCRCPLLRGARVYIIGHAPAQSLPLPGNALRADGKASRSLRDGAADHVIARAS